MVSINWRRASFKGVSFHAEESKPADGVGRYGVLHEYVKGETPYTEDLGRRAGKTGLTAYVASDSAFSDGDALVAACCSPGPGLLILPDGSAKTVLCNNCSRSESADKQGYVAFELEFLPWGGVAGPFGVDLLDRVCSAALILLSGNVAGAIGALAGIAGPLVAIAANQALSLAGLLESFRASAPLDAATSAASQSAIASLAFSAPLFATLDDVAAWTQGATAQIQTMGAALDPQDALALSSGFVATLAAAAPSSATPGLAAQNGLANAVNIALQAAAAGEAARAASTLPLTDRPSAKQAMDALVGLVEPIIDMAGQALGFEAAQPLSDALDAANRQLSVIMLDTAPLVRVDASQSYPACVAAFLLYADPQRSDELLTRNSVGTPMFLPNVFEALAE